jgi:cell division protein FtsB
LKQGLESSTKTYPSQLVVPHTTLESLRIPNYAWVVTALLALALLAVAAIYREREGLRQAQTSYQYTQEKMQATQTTNGLMRRDIQALKSDKDVITQKAQEKLNYVRPNEVVVVMR